MTIPHGAVGWSALCDCGINYLSYSLDIRTDSSLSHWGLKSILVLFEVKVKNENVLGYAEISSILGMPGIFRVNGRC